MMEPAVPDSVPPSNAVRASPFPVAPEAKYLDIRPRGRSGVSTFKRPANVRAFGEARLAYYAVC
jgi:hypothetical protein